MDSYRHMFLLGGEPGESICMPRPGEYYRRLHGLPLEEAILQHLEAARLTLCSGYFYEKGHISYHDIGELGLRVISPDEAHTRQLPVYRYYRDPSLRSGKPS